MKYYARYSDSEEWKCEVDIYCYNVFVKSNTYYHIVNYYSPMLTDKFSYCLN